MIHDTGRLAAGRWIPVFAALAAAIPACAGVVYTSTNAPNGNAIVMYNRARDGALTRVGIFATGGKGTGAGLGSQGSVALGHEDDWLLAVNAGSNDVTVFRSDDDRDLQWRSKTPSGGTTPISVAVSEDTVYVLNSGGKANIAGFHLTRAGNLVPIPGSIHTLTGVAPAQVSFNLDGSLLAVTDKTSNTIELFTVDDGVARRASVIASHGGEPFGFAFSRRNHLLVSEAFGGAPGGSAVSSYVVNEEGNGRLISPSIGTTQTAACWVAVTPNGHFAFTGNTGSGTVSSFTVARDGSLTLLEGVAGTTGGSTVDVAVGKGGRFLFALADTTGTIHSFRVAENGVLEPAGSVSGLPAFAAGLAGR